MDDTQREFLRACGERLRSARTAIKGKDGKPLTLAEAAARIGRPEGKSMWRKWELGSPPSAHTAWQVERALGIDHGTIWGGAPLPEVDADEGADVEADEEPETLAMPAASSVTVVREGFDQSEGA